MDHPTQIEDVRNVPLSKLADRMPPALRRIVPPKDSNRVPVAAFNASL